MLSLIQEKRPDDVNELLRSPGCQDEAFLNTLLEVVNQGHFTKAQHYCYTQMLLHAGASPDISLSKRPLIICLLEGNRYRAARMVLNFRPKAVVGGKFSVMEALLDGTMIYPCEADLLEIVSTSTLLISKSVLFSCSNFMRKSLKTLLNVRKNKRVLWNFSGG